MNPIRLASITVQHGSSGEVRTAEFGGTISANIEEETVVLFPSLEHPIIGRLFAWFVARKLYRSDVLPVMLQAMNGRKYALSNHQNQEIIGGKLHIVATVQECHWYGSPGNDPSNLT